MSPIVKGCSCSIYSAHRHPGLKPSRVTKTLFCSTTRIVEKKAASTAINLIFRYPEYPQLLRPLSEVAREELSHFELVLDHLELRDVPFRRLAPSPYAGKLMTIVRSGEPHRLVDVLLVAQRLRRVVVSGCNCWPLTCQHQTFASFMADCSSVKRVIMSCISISRYLSPRSKTSAHASMRSCLTRLPWCCLLRLYECTIEHQDCVQRIRSGDRRRAIVFLSTR